MHPGSLNLRSDHLRLLGRLSDLSPLNRLSLSPLNRLGPSLPDRLSRFLGRRLERKDRGRTGKSPNGGEMTPGLRRGALMSR